MNRNNFKQIVQENYRRLVEMYGEQNHVEVAKGYWELDKSDDDDALCKKLDITLEDYIKWLEEVDSEFRV